MQRISLGLEADMAGLEQARAQLKQVLQQLQQQRFRWQDWGPSPKPSEDQSARLTPALTMSIGTRLQRFEEAFFKDPRRRRNPSGARTTWSSAYQP